MNEFQDIAKLYTHDSEFLFIGYSYGSILTLKLAKMLENLGKSGKVIIIDGSPSSSKKILSEMLAGSQNVDEAIQSIVLDISLKYSFPNDTSDRKRAILAEPTWEAKLKKFGELYQDFVLYSKEYCFKSATLLKNRMTAGYNLKLDDIPILKSPIKLVKPTEATVINETDDFGLNAYSNSEIEVATVEGNHLTILEHQDTFNLINSTF